MRSMRKLGGTNKMKVGDKAYIIESGRNVREEELAGVAGDGFIVKFADTGGGICVNRSRLFKLGEVELPVKDEVPFKAQKGYHHWEVGA